MAVWRTKAFDLFGFKPGEYSFAWGKIERFADLLEIARTAGRVHDDATLDRIAEYVTWASRQNADGLASAVDLAFFLPMIRDPPLHVLFRDRLAPELLAFKLSLLMDAPFGDLAYNRLDNRTLDDDMTESDPEIAREAILRIIENQMRDGMPPETQHTYDRLVADGHSQEETMELIGCVVSSEIFDVLKQQLPYSQGRYVAALKALPELPWHDND